MPIRNNSGVIISSFRIVILFAAILLCMFIVLPGLNIDLLPKKDSKVLLVSFSLANNSPDVIEQQATSLLENALSQLSQLKKIVSVSRYHTGRVELYFDKTADLQFKQFEITLLLRQLYPKLPPGTSYPLIALGGGTEKRNNAPLLTFSIYASEPSIQIKKNAEEVFKQAIAGIPGIEDAYFSGVNGLQLVIRYSKDKCVMWHVSPGVINIALRDYFQNTYPGAIATAQGEQLFLQIPPVNASVPTIEHLLLVNDNGSPLRLGDIATVSIEEKEQEAYFRINGKNSVAFHVWSKEDVNSIVLARKVKAAIMSARKMMPEEYETHLLFDDTEFLEKELDKNYRRIGLAISILLVFIFITYRDWRMLVILCISLLVNILLAILLTWLFNVSIHLYSIAGLCVAFGIMIDNAIVMVDYYRQYRNRSVVAALLGTVITTIASLCLVFFLPENEQNVLADFSLTVMLSLVASILVTLGFIPGLYDMLVGKHHLDSKNIIEKKNKGQVGRLRNLARLRNMYYAGVAFLAGYRKLLITCMILLFGLPVFYLPAKWEGDSWYHACYNQSIGSNYYQDKLRPHVDKWLGGTLRLFIRDVYDDASFRSPEKTRLFINAELSIGNTPEHLNYILSDFEKYLSGVEGIDKFITHVYSGQYGYIEVAFKDDYVNTSIPFLLKSRIIARSRDWDGVAWTIHGIGKGFNDNSHEELSNFRIVMKGYNYNDLQLQVERLAVILSGNRKVTKLNKNERINNDDKSSFEYVLQLDRARMALLATNETEVFRKIGQVSKPVRPVGTLKLDNYTYPVFVKEEGAADFSNFRLSNNIITLDSGRQLRIKDLGQVDLTKMSSTIRKENRQYIQMVGFEYLGAAQYGRSYVDEVLQQMRQELPPGYEASRDSSGRGRDKAEQNKYLLLFFLAVAYYFICSILFENLKQPFYIIGIIPFSFIGLFLLFILGDFFFDQGGYAAFVMLSGLVVNAAIFIVNDFNRLRIGRGSSGNNRLLINATFNRGRTISLTMLATCCGFIPFLVDGADEVLWFPLAIGTIGGLVFSWFVLFFILPVLLWKKSLVNEKT